MKSGPKRMVCFHVDNSVIMPSLFKHHTGIVTSSTRYIIHVFAIHIPSLLFFPTGPSSTPYQHLRKRIRNRQRYKERYLKIRTMAVEKSWFLPTAPFFLKKAMTSLRFPSFLSDVSLSSDEACTTVAVAIAIGRPGTPRVDVGIRRGKGWTRKACIFNIISFETKNAITDGKGFMITFSTGRYVEVQYFICFDGECKVPIFLVQQEVYLRPWRKIFSRLHKTSCVLSFIMTPTPYAR